MADRAVCEVLAGVEGAGQESCVAIWDDVWDSFPSHCPGGKDSVNDFSSGLLEMSHKGELQGSLGETGGEGVMVGSRGPSGAVSTGSFHGCGGAAPEAWGRGGCGP